MTEKEQIENIVKTIRDINASLLSLCETGREAGKACAELGKSMREWQLRRIPREQVEQYRAEILDYAEQVGFNPNEIADKLTDEVLRINIVNNNAPATALTLCLV